MESWELMTKRADFFGLGERLHIDPVLVRLMRNRDLTTYEEMYTWLNGDLKGLYDPHLLKDGDKAAERILWHIEKKHRIMVANDFDCDGISAGFILLSCLKDLGGDVYVDTPDRVRDGYGINTRMVEDAKDNGVDLIITCDNGIAALEPCRLAKELGIEVIITDHHEVPYVVENGEKTYTCPTAYAVIDPKQVDCPYPFEGICGAVVAFKLMQLVVERTELSARYPVTEENPLGYMGRYLEIAAMATVADVMPLRDENHLIVKYGLKEMQRTKNPGLLALIEANNLKQDRLSAYHIGFVIGPCLNASGRLASAKLALRLLKERDENAAKSLAMELKNLNEVRKEMTQKGVEQARAVVEASMLADKVLMVPLEDCHESLAGIIAGRIREYYNRPTIVLTRTETCYKGSGRSIQAYDMFTKLSEHKDLTNRFGGHAMACGLSIPFENLDEYRKRVNEDCGLADSDLVPVVKIDMKLPCYYISEALINSFELLGPFGTGNPKPLFGDTDFLVKRAAYGKKGNVLRFNLEDQRGFPVEAVYFGDLAGFEQTVREHFGDYRTDCMFRGRPSGIRLCFAFEPDINEYMGEKSIQLVIRNFAVTL